MNVQYRLENGACVLLIMLLDDFGMKTDGFEHKSDVIENKKIAGGLTLSITLTTLSKTYTYHNKT